MSAILYRQAAEDDRENIIRFADSVFAGIGQTSDFASVMPKLYGPEADTSSCHAVAVADGKIVGAVLAYPMDLRILGERFAAVGIGTVSVAEAFRGRGIMQKLLADVLARAEQRGADLAVLGGQRQRYEYFGFEPCGVAAEAAVTRGNLSHLFRGRSPQAFRFAALEEASYARARALRQGPFYVERGEKEFGAVCRTWGNVPEAVWKEGEFFGYLVRSKDGASVSELELQDAALLPDVLFQLLLHTGRQSVRLELSAADAEKLRVLDGFCDGISLRESENFRVFRYERLILQLMRLKMRSMPLCDGKLVLQLGRRERLSIEAEGGRVAVVPSDGAPDASFSDREALRLLFSAGSAFFRAGPELPACAGSWFPLPLYWPEADQV